ncbi:hypothetical protein cypCar_00045348, partial [Cyprinus carpio]
MCHTCCEYEQISCKCPSQRTKVGYAVPCCRNALDECDPCILHQGKRKHNFCISLTSPVIGRYCGDESPSPIRSSGNSRFVSDGYNNYDGFFATFQEVS